MKMQVSAMCDVGCVRQNNEDMLVVHEHFIRDAEYQGDLEITGNTLVAVSDGMGGHNAGEMASDFVLRQLSTAVSLIPPDATEDDLRERLEMDVKNIHQSMNTAGLENLAIRGWGCTLTGVVFIGTATYFIHVGDSRLYRLRGRFLNQITNDHTLANLLNDPSIPANRIANSFGGNAPDIFMDFGNLSDRVTAGEVLLLCSDGLTGELADEDIEDALLNGAGATDLVNMARAKGGRDNISCLILRL